MAKLGTQAPAQSTAEGDRGSSDQTESNSAQEQPLKASPSPSTDEQPMKSGINISSASNNAASSDNPFSQLGTKQVNASGSRINITPANGRPVTPQKRPSTTGRPSSRSGETLEQWEDRILSSTFRITLDPEHRLDSHGNQIQYVAGTRNDLEEQNETIRLNTALLDQAIPEAASNLKIGTMPLDYLIPCWKRISKQHRALKKNGEQDPKFGVIKEARRLCMSYCIFAVTIPDMFEQDVPPMNPLIPHLLIEDPEDERGIDHDWMTEAISRFSDDDSVQGAMVGAVDELSEQLAGMNMNDDFKPFVTVSSIPWDWFTNISNKLKALQKLVMFPSMVTALAKSPRFLPPGTAAAQIERDTLLGPFFAISPLQEQVNTNYFSSPLTRDKTYVLNSQNALRMTVRTHQTDLDAIVDKFIKASKESRERMLDWFALCVNTNHKRRALQVDKAVVSSDGFMINLTACLDALCEPFMDATFSKIDRIDVHYLRRKPRVDIKEETKLNADQNASDRFYKQRAQGTSNFISEVFFLALTAHHYGTEAANSMLSTLDKDLKRLKKYIDEVELDRHKFVNDPARLRMFEAAIKKYKDRLDSGLSYKFSVEGVLLDEQTQARSMQFMRYVIVWLLRLVSPSHDFPQKPLELPLPDQQSEVFRCLPEYFLEDVVGNFKFISRNMSQIITSTQSDELVMLCITFLRSSEYIKNPYLKAGLVTILFQGTWPTHNRTKGILGDLLNSLPFATEHLLHALIKFYIEVENTGAHTQFYDKFNIRYEIFQIIKCIWSNPIYRHHLSREAKINTDFFVRFVNLLLNDVTFVLDESLSAFVKIHGLQQELRHAGPAMEPSVKSEKEEALSEAQGKARSYMQLTNETVSMLKLFTDALADSFTMPEIVQRLADMLDYNLDAMVGPKSKNLLVDNMQEYGFNPKALLSEIVDVYINLKDKENFVFAVARDGRSYKPANFEAATRILQRWALKSPEELSAWNSLGVKFKKAKELDDQAEEDLGDIPDDFLGKMLATYFCAKAYTDNSSRPFDVYFDGRSRHPAHFQDIHR